MLMTVCLLLKIMQIPFPGSVLRKLEVHKNEQKNDSPFTTDLCAGTDSGNGLR